MCKRGVEGLCCLGMKAAAGQRLVRLHQLVRIKRGVGSPLQDTAWGSVAVCMAKASWSGGAFGGLVGNFFFKKKYPMGGRYRPPFWVIEGAFQRELGIPPNELHHQVGGEVGC